MAAYELETCMGNGHEPNSKELRGTLNRLGIETTGMKKSDLLIEVGKLEDHNQQLRIECKRRGLDSRGTRNDLELRLAANDENAVSLTHRKAYWTSVAFGLFLALAGLAVSLPSISMELATQMGANLFFGVCLGLIIDGGFIVFKVVDNLSDKFKFSISQRAIIWTLMITCLIMSAVLNASKFLRAEGADPVIAISLACFISLFVFCMFAVCARMIVRCEPNVSESLDNESMPDKLQRISKEMEQRNKLAAKLA